MAVSLLGAAVSSMLGGCRPSEAKSDADDPPEDEMWLGREQIRRANIQVTTVADADMPQAITAGGRVAFNDLHVTHVFSPVTGRVTRVLAQPGQRLKRGAPLLALVSPDVGVAFSDLVKAQSDLEASEADYKRQGRLFGAGAAAQRDYEQAEDTFHTSKAEYDRAQRRATMLRTGAVDVVTQEYTLKSFIEGEVIARMVNPGAEVQGQYSGGTSAELFTIGDIKEVWVYADVQDLDLPRVKLGGDVEIRVIAYPGRVFHGKVEWISSTVDPALRTARIRCALANADEALKPEMLATVAVREPPVRRLAVPQEAVVRANESAFVYVEVGTRPDGRTIFKQRAVRAGEEQDGRVPIFDGLARGERVVSQGAISAERSREEAWPSETQLRDAEITVAQTREQDVPNVVSVGGRLTFDDLRVSHIFSPVNGRVTKVLAEMGQHVTRGTPLLSISSPDVGQFVADVGKAQASLVAAEHEYQRQKDLYSFSAPVHAGTLKDLEAAENSWRKAKAELDRARQKTQLLKAGSVDSVGQEYVLRSPIEGEVIARMANPGLEVQGQYAIGGNVAELFTIGATDKLWVLGDVFEMDRPHINEGDQVVLTVGAYPDRAFHGVVDWVSDVLDPVLHTAKVRCIVDNPEHLLKPEMYESLSISVPGKHVLAIPRQALLRLDDDTVVFLATGEHRPDGAAVFKKRRVTVNEVINGDLIPVLGGLQAGETVAVNHAVLLLGML
ncbi:MAG TPA: efflux RND transporter periplasmic adaptor subunit [Polyangia bacterium]|nr:efflux RND transporter periplasmic adaptor subunit [Polyangia bacterium]